MTALALRGYRGLRASAHRVGSVWLLLVLIPSLVALFDAPRLVPILEIATAALLGTLPYIALAVALIAYLNASGAETVVGKAFEGRETRMILFAALLGGFAPFCSCEVIPFIAGLLAVGVPLSAVMAFWLSSPLIDPPTLFITAGALGWVFAAGKSIAAVALGLLGGFGVRLMVRKGAFGRPLRDHLEDDCCGCRSSPFEGQPVWSFWKEARRRRTFGAKAWANAIFLLKWLSLAYLLEALLITYVPAELVARAVGGDGFLPIVVGALVGAPAYLNSYAAPALIAGLMQQGMSAGAAMAFMVAGAISSVPAMAAVWSLVKPSVFAAYVAFGIAGAVLIGSAFAIII